MRYGGQVDKGNRTWYDTGTVFFGKLPAYTATLLATLRWAL